MGIYSDWYSQNAGQEKVVANAEFVLKAIDKSFSSIGKLLYPVGSIYISTVNTNPANWIQGTTWVAWGSGRVPVGVDVNQNEFNVVEKTGGAKTHTLTVNEMPSHKHKIRYFRDNNATSLYSYTQHNNSMGTSYVDTTTDQDSLVISTGGNASHNNTQPYITCYMFKRTV